MFIYCAQVASMQPEDCSMSVHTVSEELKAPQAICLKLAGSLNDIMESKIQMRMNIRLGTKLPRTSHIGLAI